MKDLTFWQSVFKFAVEKYGMASLEAKVAFDRVKEEVNKVWHVSDR